jgi:hypothetical protein
MDKIPYYKTKKRLNYLKEYRKRSEVKKRQAIRFKKWYETKGKYNRKKYSIVYNGKKRAEFRQQYPDKIHAQDRIKDYIRRGKMTKPLQCEICRKNGRIEGHHPNYQEKLKVIWVCSQCHKDLHKPS